MNKILSLLLFSISVFTLVPAAPEQIKIENKSKDPLAIYWLGPTGDNVVSGASWKDMKPVLRSIVIYPGGSRTYTLRPGRANEKIAVVAAWPQAIPIEGKTGAEIAQAADLAQRIQTYKLWTFPRKNISLRYENVSGRPGGTFKEVGWVRNSEINTTDKTYRGADAVNDAIIDAEKMSR